MFNFRLAALLGKSLAELDSMPFDEYMGWQAYWLLEPWGCPADDHRTEMLLRMNYSIHAKKGSKIPDRFIDRDPQPIKKTKPNRAQLEDNIREAFAGIKVTRVVADTSQNQPAAK